MAAAKYRQRARAGPSRARSVEGSSKVTCRDLDDVISSRSGDSVLGPQSAEHLIGCERCRGLTRLLDTAADGLPPSESLLRRIRAGILGDLKPVRPLAPSGVLLFGCAIIFLSVVAVGALLLGTNGWGALSLVQRIAVFATLARSAILLAIFMVRQMVPGSKHVVAPAVLLVAIPVVLMTMIEAAFVSQPESTFLASGLMCMKNGLTYSIPAAFLLWLILRRGANLYPKLIGAAAGGLAGLAGLTVLEINCPNLNVFHILVWHWGVFAISSLGGALLGAAVESIERRRKQKVFQSFRPAR
jgi:hypothetical protein